MDKIAKAMLDSMKCPVCGGQIDLFDWARPVSKRGNNFGCVRDNSHYGMYFNHWDQPPVILSETVSVIDVNRLYDIEQKHFMGTVPFPGTTILIRDVDKEGRTIDGGRFKRLSFDKVLFDFRTLNKEKVINKVKTILVFQ